MVGVVIVSFFHVGKRAGWRLNLPSDLDWQGSRNFFWVADSFIELASLVGKEFKRKTEANL